MPTLSDLHVSLKNLCNALWDLRYSPRPVDCDWKSHSPTLEREQTLRSQAHAAAAACMEAVDALRGQFPPTWLGDDPATSKFVRLKNSLKILDAWLGEFSRPFRGYKMPMACDVGARLVGEDEVRQWDEAEAAVRQLCDELGQHVDLHAAQAASKPADHVPVERIRQLPVPEECKPVLEETVRYVLSHPEKFQTAAGELNLQLETCEKSTGDGCSYSPVFWLTDMLPDAARETPQALTGSDYERWTHRLMLLTTLACYPGDLSRFGVCGAIPWDHGTITGPLSSKDPTPIPVPVPGRAWILCELDGSLRDEMADKSGESAENRYGELVDGKKQDVVKRTPWRVRGVMGLLVDRLKPILAELPRAKTGADAAHIQRAEPMNDAEFHTWLLSCETMPELTNSDFARLHGLLAVPVRLSELQRDPQKRQEHGKLKAIARYNDKLREMATAATAPATAPYPATNPAANAPMSTELAAPDVKPEGEETDGVGEPVLSERQRNILLAMLELQAINSDSRQSTSDIAAKAEGKAANPEGFKEAIADLKNKNLLATKEGRGGGCWLIVAGRRRAKQLSKL